MDTAIDLKQKFLNIESALVHAGNIYVESASYRKNKNGPQHEFIVFRVRDKSDPNMHNCLALDRLPRHERETCPDVGSVEQEGEFDPNAASDTPPNHGNTEGTGISSGITSNSAVLSFGSLPALDRFLISVSGDLGTLLTVMHLDHSDEIERLEINHQNLSIEQVVVLASAVSSHCPKYNLYRNQCYWFASAVWEILIQLAGDGPPNSTTYTGPNAKRAKNTRLRYVTIGVPMAEKDKPAALRPKYDRDWKEFAKTVQEVKDAKRARTHEAEARAEARGEARAEARVKAILAQGDAKDLEIAKLKAELERVKQGLAETSPSSVPPVLAGDLLTRTPQPQN